MLPRIRQRRFRLPDIDRFQRIAVFAPSFDAAEQGSHADHSFAEQLQRRTGAGSFVWSRTIENDVLVARNLLFAGFQFVQVDPDRARQLFVVNLHF
jgi:hypothetical protein